MADWTDNKRPPTVADCLRSVSDWLDLADRAFAILAAEKGMELPVGTSVQGDIKMLAAWLDVHSDVDVNMYSLLDSGFLGE